MNQGNAIDWMLMGWRKYADFSGRARRKEYWMFVLGNVIISIILSIIARIIGTEFLSYIFMLASLCPSIAAGVRRLHDTDRPGLWMLLALIPFGAFVLIYFFVLEGTRGNNQFGPDPKAGEA